MKTLLLPLFFLVLVSCEKNPFGESVFYSCDHSPQGVVGLPVGCQVELKAVESLSFWLDPHQTSTVTTDSGNFVDSIVDKSGQLSALNHNSGTKALINSQLTNGRDVFNFNTAFGSYIMSPPTILAGAGNSFSFGMSFKANPGSAAIFRLSSGFDFVMEISSNLKISYDLGALTNQSIDFTFQSGLVYKLIFKYTATQISLYINEVLIDTTAHSESLPALSNLEIAGQSLFELNEILFYDKELSASEISNVFSYLNGKWGY